MEEKERRKKRKKEKKNESRVKWKCSYGTNIFSILIFMALHFGFGILKTQKVF